MEQEKQAQNNVVTELNAELQRIRDKRNALPLQEQIDKRKAEMLTSLQEIGYITPMRRRSIASLSKICRPTAKDMREFLKELPSKVYDNEEYHKEDIDRIKTSKFSYLLD